jgi:F-type H+-transporting ATPase subunit b
MEGLGINLGYLLVQIIAFIVIYTLMTRFVYDPLANTLRERRTRIARGLEDAAAAAKARLNAENEAEQIRAAARAETARIAEEARGRGEEIARQIEAEARAEAERIRAEGATRAEEERNRQLADLRSQVAQIAVAMAERLIGESVDAKRQQALVNDFFSKVPADARKLGGSVEVVSAMPLTPEEQQRVQKDVGATGATFTVDPDILGGLIVRSADRVVDGSVRSGLSELAGRMR